MLSILQELPQLCVEDASFRELLRNLEFVPTSSGSLKCPATLYDPRNEELFALLDDSDTFPCPPFKESGVLDKLQGLGLKTTVSIDTVIQSARHVELLNAMKVRKKHIHEERCFFPIWK
ncbi:zinc finger protein [Forsythia ovata]|uniref:Zinc finger protein n=1 Tax=Forsythia ovata TaxID=205694 RepID=A0ABD1SJ94_9LAMI